MAIRKEYISVSSTIPVAANFKMEGLQVVKKVEERKIEQDDIIDDASIAGAVEFLERASESDVVLTY